MRKKKKLKIGNVIITVVVIALIIAGCFFGIKALTHKSSNKKENNKEDTPTTEIVKGTIVIDAGHGGVDGGAQDPSKTYLEKNITLKAAKYLGNYLKKHDVDVVYTREDDSSLEMESFVYNGVTMTNDLRARAELGENYNADYFISLHCDSTEKPTSRNGYHIYYHKKYKDSKGLASCIVKSLSDKGYQSLAGEEMMDGSDYRIIRLNTTISVLLEMGFLNSNDLDYLVDDTKLQAFVETVGDGILQQLKDGKTEPDVVLEKQPNL